MDPSQPITAYRNALRAHDDGAGAYVRRLREDVDDVEPTVRAFVAESDRWARIARRVETLLDDQGPGHDRSTLPGVPVGVKDIMHVQGLPTRAGTDLPAAVLAGDQGTVVTRLRSEGAVVLGKTVTTEFAYFDPGPTRNPHDPNHTPGGSSSGSAAAVAAGMCPLALGTQTAGSVIRPAAFCGVVGVKPSYGRVPMDGVLPLAPSLDHLGFMTPSVADARTVAGAVYDRWVPDSTGGRPTLGIPSESYLVQASDAGQAAFERHRDVLSGAGYELQVVSEVLADVEEVNAHHGTLMAAEAALTHHDWYATFGDRYSEVLADLIERGRTTEVAALGRLREEREHLRARLETAMDDAGVDLLIAPAAPGPAPEGIENTGDPVMNVPWTFAGMPAVTIPVERAAGGLPLGLQCIGRFGDDERLLRWCERMAGAFDQD